MIISSVQGALLIALDHQERQKCLLMSVFVKYYQILLSLLIAKIHPTWCDYEMR